MVPAHRPSSSAYWRRSPTTGRRSKDLGATSGSRSRKHYPKMTPQQQARLQSRMKQWASLSPQQRAQVRERYKKLKDMPPEKRDAIHRKWKEYESLTEEEKHKLRQAHPGRSAKQNTRRSTWIDREHPSPGRARDSARRCRPDRRNCPACREQPLLALRQRRPAAALGQPRLRSDSAGAGALHLVIPVLDSAHRRATGRSSARCSSSGWSACLAVYFVYCWRAAGRRWR